MNPGLYHERPGLLRIVVIGYWNRLKVASRTTYKSGCHTYINCMRAIGLSPFLTKNNSEHFISFVEFNAINFLVKY